MGQGGFGRGAKSDPAYQPPVLSHSQALHSGWRRGTCLGSCGPCRGSASMCDELRTRVLSGSFVAGIVTHQPLLKGPLWVSVGSAPLK